MITEDIQIVRIHSILQLMFYRQWQPYPDQTYAMQMHILALLVSICCNEPFPIQLTHNFNPLQISDSLLHTLTNSEDPDEMPHDAAFHLFLHCLRPKLLIKSEKFQKNVYNKHIIIILT